MANTQSMCTSFMSELMLGQHQLGTSTITSRSSLTSPTADTLKAALYLVSATVNASTTAYSATNEVSGTGYTAGGVTVTNANTPANSNTSPTAGVAYWTRVHTFGSQTITAGTFTLTMPTNSTSAALLRISTT